MKILFVCKDRNQGYYDGKYGLFNSASFVSRSLNVSGHEAKVVTVRDANAIDREIYLFKPNIVIYEALWVPPYKVEELSLKYLDIDFVCRIHSKATFLANEGMAFEWINAYDELDKRGHLITISCNNKEFNDDLLALGYYSEYLPNIYYEYFITQRKQKDNILDVGCFGSLRPMKNHLNQAIAAMRFADWLGVPLRFHINGTRQEQNGGNVLKNLRALFENKRATLVEHQWLPHAKFLELIASMDISMQVSLSESFNIVTADAVIQNIPVVTSKEIDFVSRVFTADPTDSNDMVSALRNAYYGAGVGLQRINKYYLQRSNKMALETWLDWLNASEMAFALTGLIK